MLVTARHNNIQRKTIQVCLAVSLLIHGVAMFVHWQPEIVEAVKYAKEKVTKIRLVEPEQLAQAQKQKARSKPQVKRQIITTEKSDLELEPVPTRFLSEQNQAVDRQTVAKKIGSFKEAGKGQKSGSEVVKKEIASAKNTAKKAKVSLSALGQIKIPKDLAPKKAERELAALGLENGKAGLAGFAKNNDYIQDIPLGDMTKLNTVEFKYYGFYHRIKQRLEQHWGSTLQEKAKTLVKRGRRVPASEDKITALSITLDTMGRIVDIELRSSSGVSEFDEAAIDSFNKAGPFPNPPQGMMVNGHAKIEWGFVVKS